jgi:hypothetical protein
VGGGWVELTVNLLHTCYLLMGVGIGEGGMNRRGDPTLPENNYSSNQQNKSGGRFLRRTS